MAEKCIAGGAGSPSGAFESVCIHTRKIYGSCKDKDCIEDLRFYPTQSGQSVLDRAQSIRGGRAELLHVFVDVEPVNFNRGYYTVDMRFYYRIVLQAMTGGARYTEVEGLAAFDKRVILFGSEAGAKIYSSRPAAEEADAQLDLTANLPTAYVEAVDPMVLSACFVEKCNCACDCICGCGCAPEGILSAFDEPLVFEDNGPRRVSVSLGQFSIVRLERDTQLRIPIYDYSVPCEECRMAGLGDGCVENPCAAFRDVDFPLDEFFPPNSTDDGDSCGCGCGCRN